MKTLLYKELIYSKLAITIVAMVGLSAFMMSPLYMLVPTFFLWYYLFSNTIVSQHKMSTMIELNIDRVDIVKVLSLSTIIKQSVFILFMAFFASFNHLINEPSAEFLVIGITAFALIIITFAVFNFFISLLRYINNFILNIACFLLAILIPTGLMILLSVFSTVPTLDSIFNNNSIENLGAQLGLLVGAIALYCLSAYAEYILSNKLIKKHDIDDVAY